MRQTSRAVALLLALDSANAALVLNVPLPTAGIAFSTDAFNPAVSAEGAPTNSLQLNSRTAGYVNRHTVYGAQAGASWGATIVSNKAKLASGAALAAAVTITGASGCMQCLNAAAPGVWCSSTYSYLSTAVNFQQDVLTADHNSTFRPATVAASITGAAFDNGSCCDTNANFNTFVWTQVQRLTLVAHTAHTDTNSQLAAGLAMVESACVATKSTYAGSAGTVTFGASEIDNTTAAYSGWWCSNGLYKKVKTGAAILLNAQQLIPNGNNKRKELAQVGCP
jgi:hypothetical protein